ncbi:hypothetical protein PUN28_019056 [Cardiocondyla obscurior]|uniref:Uncharacterized protein n=1 Tax=Cardiocondyla obscurior TaxID=286306 RepID=A0AAW2EHB1_9HYME
MEIITLMASPTRERGATPAPPLPSTPRPEGIPRMGERSRHLDGNVTLPSCTLARHELCRMVRSHHLARLGAGASEPARAFFPARNGDTRWKRRRRRRRQFVAGDEGLGDERRSAVPGADSSCVNPFLSSGTAKRDRYAKTANPNGSPVCAK